VPGVTTTDAASRLARARSILDTTGVDGLLVSSPATKRWLSGFVLEQGEEHHSGWSGTLLVTRDAALVMVDARYLEQTGEQCRGWDVRLTNGRIGPEVARLAGEIGARHLAAEAEAIPHADWTAVEADGLELAPADDAFRRLRLVKDADEVAAIGRAGALTEACFGHLLGWLRPGQTEVEVAWEIESWFRTNGAEALAFGPLVLAGARGSMPHGHAGDAQVAAGEPLLIDFGCQVDGYRSDMTRTVSFGEPSALFRQRYDAVRGAQQAAFEAARPGVAGSELDLVARGFLAHAGLGPAFSHGLGHGIGLDTHEAPMLLDWHDPLEAGMVFTLEPGVYFPGEMGIRIEDDVHLTEDGAVRLTDAPRELLVL
jgi:Xaa-Pro aminopeptidase